MSLPTSRNKTYSQGDQIKSADLNDLQDQIIAIRSGEIVIPAANMIVRNSGTDPGQYEENLDLVEATGAGGPLGFANAPIVLPVGYKVTEVHTYVHNFGADGIAVVFESRVLSDNTPTTHASADAFSTSPVSMTGLSVAVLATERYYVQFAVKGSNPSFPSVRAVRVKFVPA